MSDPFQHRPRIVLNQYKRFEDGRVLPINIFGSNAEQGTAIQVEVIYALFDIGVQYSDIEKLKDLTDFIFVSHAHSDHLVWATVKHFLEGHPSMKVFLPEFVEIPKKFNYLAKQIRYVKNQRPVSLSTRTGDLVTVTPYHTPHGPEKSCAYLINFKGSNLLFCTDLSDTSSLPQSIDFDIIMIETNYDEDAFISKEGAGGAKNHLSVQKALRYATTHLTEYGRIIPLHFGPSMRNFNQMAD